MFFRLLITDVLAAEFWSGIISKAGLILLGSSAVRHKQANQLCDPWARGCAGRI